MPFLRTELVITDCREITQGEDGHATVGDIVNGQIGAYLNTPGHDGPPPRPQSITIGWETEGDWYNFAASPGNREMYPAPSNRKARLQRGPALGQYSARCGAFPFVPHRR